MPGRARSRGRGQQTGHAGATARGRGRGRSDSKLDEGRGHHTLKERFAATAADDHSTKARSMIGMARFDVLDCIIDSAANASERGSNDAEEGAVEIHESHAGSQDDAHPLQHPESASARAANRTRVRYKKSVGGLTRSIW